MTTYILLRNNKESGPFSIDQLREMGLRSDDLIWVEGQSASWRNPPEIGELKELLSKETIQKSQAPVTGDPGELSGPAIPAASNISKSSVFVALPDKKMEPAPVKEPVKAQGPVNTGHRDHDSQTGEKPKETVETKYAMSLDEIKQRYLRSLEERRKKSRSFNFQLPGSLRRAAVYIGLVGFGALLVLFLVRTTAPSHLASDQKRLPGKLETRPTADAEETAAGQVEADIVLPESYYETQTPSVPETRPEVPVKRPGRPLNPAPGDNSASTPGEQGVPAGDYRISIPVNETAEIKTLSTSELAEHVSVKTNSYTIAALGGIRDLELTLRNDSPYTLDKVVVEVRFLNPNGNTVKTEDIQFKSVRPGGIQTLGMKKSNRGVKVSHKIIRIESRELGTHTAGI